MSSFSPSVNSVIEAFAGSLGLPARPARDGSYSFVFERAGTLSFTPGAGGTRLIASLAAQPRTRDRSAQRKLLASAGYNPTTGQFLHAGLTADGSFVFAVTIEDREVSLPAIEDALQRLMAAQQSI